MGHRARRARHVCRKPALHGIGCSRLGVPAWAPSSLSRLLPATVRGPAKQPSLQPPARRSALAESLSPSLHGFRDCNRAELLVGKHHPCLTVIPPERWPLVCRNGHTQAEEPPSSSPRSSHSTSAPTHTHTTYTTHPYPGGISKIPLPTSRQSCETKLAPALPTNCSAACPGSSCRSPQRSTLSPRTSTTTVSTSASARSWCRARQ